MEGKFICPFCKQPLTIFIPNRVYCCNNDQLFVEIANRTSYFTSTAKKHLVDSQVLLAEFKTSDPLMVLSKHKLYTEDFRLEDCIFVDAKVKSDIIKCLSFERLTEDIINKHHLIAGAGLLADGILRTVFNTLKFKAEESRLERTEIPDAERQLWVKVVNELNADEFMDVKSYEAINSYFQPIPEAALQVLHHIFNKNVPTLITEEQALFTWIFIQPQFNITWGASNVELHNNVFNYLKAIVRDVNKVTMSDKEELSPDLLSKIPTSLLHEIKSNYFSSVPTLAVNQNDVLGSVTFDILNQQFLTDFFGGHVKDGKVSTHIVTHSAVCHVLGLLWNKYFSEYKDLYGLQSKKEFLLENNVPVPTDLDELVLTFWKEIDKRLNKETTN